MKICTKSAVRHAASDRACAEQGGLQGQAVALLKPCMMVACAPGCGLPG